MTARTDWAAAFGAAADHAVAVASREDVASAWDAPSALEAWSVGGLTAHLAAQVPTALSLLRAEPGGDPIPLLDHYAQASWVGAPTDAEVNVGIRSGGDEQAADGPATVLAHLLAARAEVGAVIGAQSPDRAVLIPWQGWSLRLGDFLTTRMMEIVVHAEDVAASVGFATPPLSPTVLDPVLHLLTALSVRRHGQGAVVSALSRAERAPRSIAAF